MIDLQKFFADVERIKKRERAEHSSYDSSRVVESVIELFVSNNRDMTSLASSFADYWQKTYIAPSSQSEEEPTRENIDRLAAMQSLLDGETFATEILNAKDWRELSSLVNFEAEDIPMDMLEKMMMIFVDKQAL